LRKKKSILEIEEGSCNVTDRKWRKFIACIRSLSPLFSVKILGLVDRTDLFKISNLVYVGREIVTNPYKSLEGPRQFMVGIVSQQVRRFSVSKLMA
jgi:hypothetical protein